MIPARYSSVRLPGKLLLPIAGKPLILHTLERARSAAPVSRVIVATDDARIFDAVVTGGGEAMMTSPDHRSGTDRVAEAAESLPDKSVIVNVQGDEPMIAPATIDAAVSAMLEGDTADIVTTSEPIAAAADLENPNVVKVATNDDDYALYFSRAAIPFPRRQVMEHGDLAAAAASGNGSLSVFRKHTGLYVYRREYLLRFAKLPPSKLERIEMLEQLRALENGGRIRVIKVAGRSIGVDTWEDYERVRAMIEGNG